MAYRAIVHEGRVVKRRPARAIAPAIAGHVRQLVRFEPQFHFAGVRVAGQDLAGPRRRERATPALVLDLLPEHADDVAGPQLRLAALARAQRLDDNPAVG